ncbi:MAG TPA: CBS domain-containing protein [Thermodesulfobacteriota bacterium]|nr:CBS domain-containing protein [Thermodesulfobacteriota bacterium]
MSGKRKTRAELLSEVINRNVVTVAPTAALSEAAYLMMNEDIGALVVVDGDARPVGIITDRDLVVSAIAEGVNPEEVTVEEIMTKDLITVDEDTDLFEMLSILSENSIRRLPVKRGPKLIGIVSVDDLIVLVATELVNLAMALSSKSKVL